MYVRPLIPGQANTRSNYTPLGHYSFLDKYSARQTLAGRPPRCIVRRGRCPAPPNARDQRDKRREKEAEASFPRVLARKGPQWLARRRRLGSWHLSGPRAAARFAAVLARQRDAEWLARSLACPPVRLRSLDRTPGRSLSWPACSRHCTAGGRAEARMVGHGSIGDGLTHDGQKSETSSFGSGSLPSQSIFPSSDLLALTSGPSKFVLFVLIDSLLRSLLALNLNPSSASPYPTFFDIHPSHPSLRRHQYPASALNPTLVQTQISSLGACCSPRSSLDAVVAGNNDPLGLLTLLPRSVIVPIRPDPAAPVNPPQSRP